eukprot:1160146-Pelagomonas_calceolata.AAC.1
MHNLWSTRATRARKSGNEEGDQDSEGAAGHTSAHDLEKMTIRSSEKGARRGKGGNKAAREHAGLYRGPRSREAAGHNAAMKVPCAEGGSDRETESRWWRSPGHGRKEREVTTMQAVEHCPHQRKKKDQLCLKSPGHDLLCTTQKPRAGSAKKGV